MRLITTVGVSIFYIPIALYFNSYRALFITINGIVYHSNEEYIYLRYYDCTCNIIMITYTFYNNIVLFGYSNMILIMSTLNAIIIYIIKNILYDKQYISRDINDYMHVIGVQGILAYGLYNDCLQSMYIN